MINTIYIVGPTASGKTALSVAVARQLGAEIICADSQTIRRTMNIGTAKPSQEEQTGILHHMLDIIDPYESYSVLDFQKEAKNIIQDIHKRNKVAVIVGGTGLYVDSLYFNYAFPERVNDPVYRDKLSGLSVEVLHEMIEEKGIAKPKNNQNPRHLVGTLLRSGARGQKGTPDTRSCIVGLNPGREAVVERINRRVEDMFSMGFVQEVESILQTYGRPPKEFDAIGYRITLRYIDGEITLEEAKELFKIADRQYAKRQMSWFTRNPHIQWFVSPEMAKDYILKLC